MEKTAENKIVLAIESAVRGGSICLLRGETVLCTTEGSAKVSRAEDLLPNIVDLIDSSGITKSDIETIAVSNGPGSYTGIRIGIATALGLVNALDIRCAGISCLEAVANVFASSENLSVAVPFGKDDICIQNFSAANGKLVASTDIDVIDVADLSGSFAGKHEWDAILHPEIYDRIACSGDQYPEANLVRAEPNLSFAVGIAAQRFRDLAAPQALYVRNPRFRSQVG